MSRPESIDDLPDYVRQGHLIAVVEGGVELLKYPTLGRIVMDLMAEGMNLGLVKETGRIEVPLTADEIERKIAAAQRQWDHSQERYQKALADPSSVPEDVWRGITNTWARAEGLEPVEWDAEVSA